ncbi:hypothetical protein O181_021496 [Austropuccinia psidii MF-1]|uniref:Reverse transcriptase Ty1/copia-type domain-containing protein n=1 Tax=Austropuccinia psidii MF-1 TaxID=1389203 RepID=A0A9Q3GVU2_9BASI|nr:hypothetical protein [Austropuccinia psidii MF-1]
MKKPTHHLGYTLNWLLHILLILHQKDFCTKILDEFNMCLANPIKTPSPIKIHALVSQPLTPIDKTLVQKVIGMVNYLSLDTKTNITFTTNLLLQFTNKSMTTHWNIIKHLLRFLNETRDMGLQFTKSAIHEQLTELIGWEDFDYGTAVITKKLSSGYAITFLGNPILWTTKKQEIVAQSTMEA